MSRGAGVGAADPVAEGAYPAGPGGGAFASDPEAADQAQAGRGGVRTGEPASGAELRDCGVEFGPGPGAVQGGLADEAAVHGAYPAEPGGRGGEFASGPGALWGRLAALERRVRAVVEVRRAAEADPDDPYRGQYLTPEGALRVLDAAPGGLGAVAVEAWEPPAGSELAVLAARFALTPLDLDLLLVALAPDLDARFEPLYGFLNDDLTRRRPTVGLALALCGLAGEPSARFRLGPGGPLVDGGLLEVAEPERPPLSRVLTVPDRVTAHLLGGARPDTRLAGLLAGEAAEDPTADPAEAHRVALAANTGPVHLRSRGGDAEGLALAALRAAGLRTLALDAAALGRRPTEAADIARAAAREARLTGAGAVVGPLEALPDLPAERARTIAELCAALRGVPLLTHGAVDWDPSWSPDTPLTLPVPPPSPARQSARWRHALTKAAQAAGTAASVPPAQPAPTGAEFPGAAAGVGAGPGAAAQPAPAGGEFDAVAAHRLDARQLHRAAGVAVRSAALAGRPVGADDLRAAVRGQNSAGLDRLARRVEPGVGWGDLVLPAGTHRRLRELALRARHRDQVLGQWRMRPGGGRGRGVIALFSGGSGTGKTMSAEVVAADLGMDLYVVDLSTVVDKYVGETEKNLERIFTEASAVNAVLLFDEADAIFGKRSEVKDAHDRHANVESAYLLQRMESFDGIAVLTTNLRANLDEAFTRRLDVVADFPMPDAVHRRALWESCLGKRLPRAADLDLAFCADRFELAGGSIRACAVTAAYLAAEAGGPLTMRQAVTAVAQEYRKLGRLVLPAEFGPWLAEVADA